MLAPTLGIALLVLAVPALGQSTGVIGTPSPGANNTGSLRGGAGLPVVPNNALPPMTSTLTPGFGTPAPSIGTPAPDFGTPTPSFSTPTPNFSTPTPSFSTPSPFFGTAPGLSTSTPSFITQPAPPGSASSGQSFGGVRVCPAGQIIC